MLTTSATRSCGLFRQISLHNCIIAFIRLAAFVLAAFFPRRFPHINIIIVADAVLRKRWRWNTVIIWNRLNTRNGKLLVTNFHVFFLHFSWSQFAMVCMCACLDREGEWGHQSAQFEESKVNNTLLDECRNLWITETKIKCRGARV